jgi:hypothetical protein
MTVWKHRHPSDERLLLAIDGELAPRLAAKVHKHLEACSTCRGRSKKFERALSVFIDAHLEQMKSQIQSGAVSRAELGARLRQAESASRRFPWHRGAMSDWWKLGGATALLIFLVFTLRFFPIPAIPSPSAAISFLRFAPRIEPKPNLTPGATRSIATLDLCSGTKETESDAIPTVIQKTVLQEYGLTNARPADYELDYLVTPELGGTTDIRNIWPQPYRLTEWNAHVKDALENLLHNKVCSGEIDLTTAQHDIATDWISAYKKYFHTDRPLANEPGLDPRSRQDSIDDRTREASFSVRLFANESY